MKQLTSKSTRILKALKKQPALVIIALFFIVMPFLRDTYLTGNNITQLLFQSAVLIIIAAGVTFVILCGGSNLSVGATMCTGGIVAVMLQDYMPLGLVFVCVLIVGALHGLLAGFLVARLNLNAFIVTLGLQMMHKGINLVITDAQQIRGSNPLFVEIGNQLVFDVIPVSFLVAIAVVLVSHVVLRRTSYGRNCYAVGGDMDVAKYSGIKVVQTKLIAYIISGALAAMGGFFMSARLNTASGSFGELTSLLVNCGVVVGGTSFSGGVGGVINTFGGLMMFAVLENAMQQLNLNVYIQQLAQGLIIVAILGMGCYERKRKLEDV